MKRLLLTILALFYLGMSTGMTVHLHYCMGELVKFGLSAPEQSACPYCGMKKKEESKKPCCKDDAAQAKVEQSPKADSQNYQFPLLMPIPADPMAWKIPVAVWSVASHNAHLPHTPPEKEPVPVFIRNCTYRI